MKITKRQLKRIIKEEKANLLKENKYKKGAKLGYGSGNLKADLSDEMAMLFEYALDNGMSEMQIQDLAKRTLRSVVQSPYRR
jgi:hypothetical protein